MSQSKLHRHQTLKFPEGFLWGAATSAFQVEGNCTNSEWYTWEQNNMPEDKRSGQAIDQYNRFEADFDLIKSLGHNTHRISIEWSRIEPENGLFDESEIEHYRKVLQALKQRDIKVVLTLWHFSNPAWFAELGGWLSVKAAFYLTRFVERILPEFAEYVDLWITLNEPSGYAFDGFIRGKYPPQHKSLWDGFWVNVHFASAHKSLYKLIHKKVKGAQVGLAHSTFTFDAYHKHSIRENIAVWVYDLIFNHTIYKLTGMKNHDFLGINYYFNYNISFNGEKSHLPQLVDINTTQKEVSDLGWEIHPEGMFETLMDMSDYHKPIYITENGIASLNDDRRVRFLINYLKEVYHAISAGVDVRGYLHWSLVDNYEWCEGFYSRFGLVEIDLEHDLRRHPKPSSQVYHEIIKQNGIPHFLLKLLGHSESVIDVLKEYDVRLVEDYI